MTIEELIAKVKELISKNPDNMYPRGTCSYTRGTCSNGTVGCIFGQAFRALGWPLTLTGSIATVLPKMGISGTPEQIQWCVSVQAKQDSGHPWSECDGSTQSSET